MMHKIDKGSFDEESSHGRHALMSRFLGRDPIVLPKNKSFTSLSMPTSPDAGSSDHTGYFFDRVDNNIINTSPERQQPRNSLAAPSSRESTGEKKSSSSSSHISFKWFISPSRLREKSRAAFNKKQQTPVSKTTATQLGPHQSRMMPRRRHSSSCLNDEQDQLDELFNGDGSISNCDVKDTMLQGQKKLLKKPQSKSKQVSNLKEKITQPRRRFFKSPTDSGGAPTEVRKKALVGTKSANSYPFAAETSSLRNEPIVSMSESAILARTNGESIANLINSSSSSAASSNFYVTPPKNVPLNSTQPNANRSDSYRSGLNGYSFKFSLDEEDDGGDDDDTEDEKNQVSKSYTNSHYIPMSSLKSESVDLTNAPHVSQEILSQSFAQKSVKDKRRNTISIVAFNKLSEFGSTSSIMPNKVSRSELNEITQTDIFEAIEQENLDMVMKKLIINPDCINSKNECDFTPLDMAIMINNVPIITQLFISGAKENPEFNDWNDRYFRVCDQLARVNRDLSVCLTNLDFSTASLSEMQDYDQRLKSIQKKMTLYRKMKSSFESTNFPGKVTNMSVESYGPTSLLVSFDEPAENGGAMIFEYMIEWSLSNSFDREVERVLVTFVDDRKKEYILQNLETNRAYYVRVSCANLRGYGPTTFDFPPFCVPSYWRDGETIWMKRNRKIRKTTQLENRINMSKADGDFVNVNILSHIQKVSKLKKNMGLKNFKSLIKMSRNPLHHNSPTYTTINYSNIKFTKQVKRTSCYLVSVMYEDQKILTTVENHLPMIEIDENYSFQGISADLQFLTKLSFNWSEVGNLKNMIEHTIHSDSLRLKYLILSVVKQMQNLLDMLELGRVYYQCVKHSHNGSAFFVVVKNLKNLEPGTGPSQNPSLKFCDLEKFVANHVKDLKNSTANQKIDKTETSSDFSFIMNQLRAVIDYDQTCENRLERGLYVGFMKMQSTLEFIKMLVPRDMPNSLPYQKIRDNPNLSREEWRMLTSLNVEQLANVSYEINNIQFVKMVHEAICQLCLKLNLKEDEINSLRFVVKRPIEVNEHITYILVCPSSDQICTMNLSESYYQTSLGSDYSLSSSSSPPNQSTLAGVNTNNQFIYMPVQVFEALHLLAYNTSLLRTYIRISLILEIESLAANQYSREAFLNEETTMAKKIIALLADYHKQHEEVWKDSRWIVEWINYAREKPTSSASQLSYTSSSYQNLQAIHSNSSSPVHSSHQLSTSAPSSPATTHHFFMRFSELQRFLTIMKTKTTKFTFRCEWCKSVIESISINYGDPDLKKAIHELMTTLPDSRTCDCKNKKPSIEYELNHLNTLLADQDNYLINKDDLSPLKEKTDPPPPHLNKSYLFTTQKSIDEVDSNEFMVPTSNTNTNDSNKLVSKLFITSSNSSSPSKSPTTLTPGIHPSSSSSSVSGSQKSNCIIVKSYVPENTSDTKAPNTTEMTSNGTTTSTSSSGCSSISSIQSSTSSSSHQHQAECIRKFLIIVDFATGLKLDFHFECLITGRGTSKEVISSVLRRLNSYIDTSNQMNRLNSSPRREDTAEPSNQSDQLQSSNVKLTVKRFAIINRLDEHADSYYLSTASDPKKETKDHILSDEFLVANLADVSGTTPLNDKLYLRSKSGINSS